MTFFFFKLLVQSETLSQEEAGTTLADGNGSQMT